MNEALLFNHWETRVMARLGIRDRDVMRALRTEHLTERVDWMLVRGRVCLNEEGVEKIAAAVKSAPPTPTPAPNGIIITDARRLLPERAGSQLPKVFTVVKPAAWNIHALVCVPEGYRLEDLQARVVVKVRDNRNFLPRSRTGRILAVPGSNGVWEFAGNPESLKNDPPRCPRYRGRW